MTITKRCKKEDYSAFLEEYQQLGHMEKITQSSNTMSYYIPNHLVFKPSSTTTKMRVVFDASCKTDSGTSLNETLMVGSKLQDDIHVLLLYYDFENTKLV